jgi:hypothetical protein
MRAVTIDQARQLRRRIAARSEMAWEIASLSATACYLMGRPAIAQRAAAVVMHDRVLRDLHRPPTGNSP